MTTATSPIPFFKYPELFKAHEEQYVSLFREVCGRGAFILQKELEEFEANLAKFLNVKHAIGVADGTEAIVIALRAAGVKPGDEVIVPSHTYIASVAAIHFTGATPILVECGRDHLIEPESVEAAITPKTRCIMPVQLNGRTANMARLQAIADKHHLIIVEDAAQGFGSKFKGRSAGTFGKAGTFSFYPAKILGCFGDGGAVVTNDDEIARQILLLRDHGRNKDGLVVTWGYNSRLDNLQAAVLNFKLVNHIEADLKRRREIASRYHAALSGNKNLVLPFPPDNGDHYDVFQNYEIEAERRDELKKYLETHGIRTLIQWGGKAVHQLRDLKLNFNLPATDKLFQRCMLLPMSPVHTNDEIDRICDTINKFYKS